MSKNVIELDTKVLILGNSFVGKTTLINCLTNGPSDKRFPATNGR